MSDSREKLQALVEKLVPCLCTSNLCSQPECGEFHDHKHPECPRHVKLPEALLAAQGAQEPLPQVNSLLEWMQKNVRSLTDAERSSLRNFYRNAYKKVETVATPVQGAGTPTLNDEIEATKDALLLDLGMDPDLPRNCQRVIPTLQRFASIAAAHQSPVEALRERLAKALWDNEIEEELRLGKGSIPRESYAQWPKDAARQPYCQSTYRQADAVIRALAAQEKPPAQRLSGPPPSDPFHISKIPDMLRRLANEYETECCELDCDDLRSAANVVALAGSPAQPSEGGTK